MLGTAERGEAVVLGGKLATVTDTEEPATLVVRSVPEELVDTVAVCTVGDAEAQAALVPAGCSCEVEEALARPVAEDKSGTVALRTGLGLEIGRCY